MECSLFVKARIAREQNLEINTQLNECLDIRCPKILSSSSSSSSTVSVELPGNRAIVLDTDGVGRAQRKTLTRCGSWRSGTTLLASSVLSLSEENTVPIWIEISSTATGNVVEPLFANDDVSYFSALAARSEASVHVFEPNAKRVLRMLKNIQENSYEDLVSIHPMFVSASNSSDNLPGVRLCTAEEKCEASVFATRTTLDRTILPVLYRFKESKRRVRWIHLRVRDHDETMNVLRGARKLLGLRWIDTMLIDRRRVDLLQSRSRSARDVSHALSETGFVTLCLDNTTLASDIGNVYKDEIDRLISERDASSSSFVLSCDMMLVSRSETLLVRSLKRASELAKTRPLHDVHVIDRDAEMAAEMWLSGKGRVWLQRVRRAGGSMLCHNFRLNSDLERSGNSSIVRFGNTLKVKVDISKSHEEDYCTTNPYSSSSSSPPAPGPLFPAGAASTSPHTALPGAPAHRDIGRGLLGRSRGPARRTARRSLQE